LIVNFVVGERTEKIRNFCLLVIHASAADAEDRNVHGTVRFDAYLIARSVFRRVNALAGPRPSTSFVCHQLFFSVFTEAQ
jgi:hypothetical protein